MWPTLNDDLNRIFNLNSIDYFLFMKMHINTNSNLLIIDIVYSKESLSKLRKFNFMNITKCPWEMIHDTKFVQQTKFAINHNLGLWVCFVVGITTILMLYLISRARKFLALFASFSLLVISFVVVFSRKRRDGPNTAQHTTTLPRGGDLEKIPQKLPQLFI